MQWSYYVLGVASMRAYIGFTKPLQGSFYKISLRYVFHIIHDITYYRSDILYSNAKQDSLNIMNPSILVITVSLFMA